MYSVSLTDGNIANAPIAILIIDSQKKSLISYQKNNPIKINNSLNCDSNDFWIADKDFRELYPNVRDFAFSKTISITQKEILQSFYKAFRLLVNDSFYALYKKLFADFFLWTKQFVPEE